MPEKKKCLHGLSLWIRDISLGLVFNFMLQQCFRHKDHLVRVRKRLCFWPNISNSKNEQWSLMRNIQSCSAYKSWKRRLEQWSLLEIVQWFLAYKCRNSVLNGVSSLGSKVSPPPPPPLYTKVSLYTCNLNGMRRVLKRCWYEIYTCWCFCKMQYEIQKCLPVVAHTVFALLEDNTLDDISGLLQ